MTESGVEMEEKDDEINAPNMPASDEVESTASDNAPVDKENQNQEASRKLQAPPNGGYGWVCTACCALINAHTWGLNSSYGVFLAHYLATNTYPGATSLEFAFVGGLSISCAMLISPLATLTTRLYGTKVTLFTGVVLEAGSLIAASFAYEIWQLFLSQGVCFGLGMGFLFVGSVGIPAQWFTTKRSLANGLAAAGSGLGGLIYSLAAGAMLTSIGLAWTFRVLGILAFGVNSICTILLKDRNKVIGSSQRVFDAKLFARAEYLLLCGYGWFSMLGYVVLIFSLANYANAIGLNASQASIVSALLNLGQGLGRPPIGYFSDTIGRINMAGLMTFLCAIFTFAIFIPAKSFAVLIVFAILGGTVAGTFWATIAPVAAEVTGLKHVPSALNLIWLVIVLPVTFSEAIALEIVNGTGSYLGTQVWVGMMYIAAAICVLFLRGWKIGELEEIARLEGQGAGEVNAMATENDESLAQAARATGRRSITTEFWKWRKV
ncbi:transporter MCH2 [Lecanosticta acicola]|uniref:Transporter MCH2 n=1 Tax=Lecanosticta acicola TaxID=111012 RepID=A0AAI8Z4K1_9PEZI|nr:transporter MCH2 [Lecanosticta acicola]